MEGVTVAMAPARTFPERLRRARASQAWSQHDLADLTDGVCSRRTVQNYEAGYTTPRAGSRHLNALAVVLRVEPDELLYGEDTNAHD